MNMWTAQQQSRRQSREDRELMKKKIASIVEGEFYSFKSFQNDLFLVVKKGTSSTQYFETNYPWVIWTPMSGIMTFPFAPDFLRSCEPVKADLPK